MKKTFLFMIVVVISFFTGNQLKLFSFSDPLDYLSTEEQRTIGVYQKAIKSVVNVTNIQLARSWWDYGAIEIPKGSGSGVVWSSEGYIVTNFHVIEGGDLFLISFHNDKKQYKAKVVGGSPRKDLAVLKLIDKKKNLEPVTVGLSHNLMVGQKGIAIGNPFGLDHTLTVGVISALGRKIKGYAGVQISDMVQTDAAVNPGNSGGPLLDSKGRLIGINTMIYSPSGSSAGVGFAVPIDTVGRIIPDLIKYGKEIRPGLGITSLPVHIKDRYSLPKGVVIYNVSPGGAADQVGLKGIGKNRFGEYILGDIILEINNEKVNSANDIYNVLDKFKIGDVVTIKFLRNDSLMTTRLKLMPLTD